ncbi:MAG TPA: glycoside hydrolase family 99-like domain-containing protein, partial [Caldimonas sp.]|nr:glycoside hydrolase family 99-like domain-containing protein [Caldimonas sp.]
SKLKYLALYLPQFHAIPENDEWWGKGFTEWTNTKPMKPLFEGHYQPHEPSEELGYYDLSDVDVMVRQAELAKSYGISGFCYYYYWFNGRTLLETPLRNMLGDARVAIPFCLCWANHNWTRRWDGLDQEMLLEQTYDETTYSRFIDDLAPYFADPRYIRVEGKPVLLVYQAELLLNPKEAVSTWRNHARDQYGTDLYLICVQQSGATNPGEFGYDAAVDFTPKWRPEDALPHWEHPKYFKDDTSAVFFDYRKNTLKSVLRSEPYKLFRCVYPMWDNSPRRKGTGAFIVVNSSLALFRRFLIEMSKLTVANFDADERFLFINAWNEWAEGTHLEPCRRHGDGLLRICREVSSMAKDDLLRTGFDQTDLEWIGSLVATPRAGDQPVETASTVTRIKKGVKRVLRGLQKRYRTARAS